MELSNSVLVWAFPALVLVTALEAALLRRRGARYPWRESAVSLAIAVGHRASGLVAGGTVFAGFSWLWQHRLWSVPMNTWWGPLLLFFAVEFLYYWHHRVSHECRWFWATHAVHHSARHLNLSAAYRLGWTGAVSGAALFFAPLPLLGFAPQAVVTALALNLLYQFWLHTELIPKLGWFERVFNTPSHHRVHHAMNAEYLDRNYGGVLIIFDRLFGTFAYERDDEPCRYGWVKPLDSTNPLTIVFHEWLQVARDVKAANTWKARFAYLFGPPGWSADGSCMTSKAVRAANHSKQVELVRVAN